MKSAITLFIAIIVFSDIATFASERRGQLTGGGCVIQDGDKTLLLDFYEHNNGIKPYIPPHIKDKMKIREKIKETFSSPKNEKLVNAITRKLNEVYTVFPSFAIEIAHNITSYSWVFGKPEVVSSNDIGLTGIQLEEGACQWIAARSDKESLLTIWITRELWEKMTDVEQRVGLVFHEAIYAMLVEKKSVKTSDTARSLNAKLFEQPVSLSSAFLQTDLKKKTGQFYMTLEQYKTDKREAYEKICKHFSEQVSRQLLDYARALEETDVWAKGKEDHEAYDKTYFFHTETRETVSLEIEGERITLPSPIYKFVSILDDAVLVFSDKNYSGLYRVFQDTVYYLDEQGEPKTIAGQKYFTNQTLRNSSNGIEILLARLKYVFEVAYSLKKLQKLSSEKSEKFKELCLEKSQSMYLNQLRDIKILIRGFNEEKE